MSIANYNPPFMNFTEKDARSDFDRKIAKYLASLKDKESGKFNEITAWINNFSESGDEGESLAWISDYDSFADMISRVGTDQMTVIINKSVTVSSSVTKPANLSLVFPRPGMLVLGAGVTLTWAGEAPNAGTRQIFSGAGVVVFSSATTVYPEWWGAVGDGSTDDTASWQSMVNGLPSGSEIIVPSGTTILSNIENFASISLNGTPGASIIKHKASSTDHMFEASGNIHISGVTFDGNKANISGWYGTVYFDGTTGGSLTVRDCTFQNTRKCGLYVVALSGTLGVSGCYFTGMSEWVLGSGGTLGVYVGSGDGGNIDVHDNRFDYAAPDTSANAPGGIQCYAADGYFVTASIHHNYFNHVGSQNGTNNIGAIHLYGRTHHTVIDGNRFYNYTGGCIKANASENTIITNNIIDTPYWDYGASALVVQANSNNYGPFHYYKIVNNTINGHSPTYALQYQGTSGDEIQSGLIAGNHIVGSKAGMLLDHVNGASILNNVIDGCTGTTAALAGIYVLQSEGEFIISGNTIVNGASYGIYSDTDISSANFIISNNAFDSNTYRHIAIDGADSVIVKSNRFTGSLSPTSIQNCTTYRAQGNSSDTGTYYFATVTNAYIANDNEPITETITASGGLRVWGNSDLDSGGGAIAGILGDGNQVGDIKTITMSDASSASTVSVTHHETSDPEVFTFNNVGDMLVLMWTGATWVTVKNYGVGT